MYANKPERLMLLGDNEVNEQQKLFLTMIRRHYSEANSRFSINIEREIMNAAEFAVNM